MDRHLVVVAAAILILPALLVAQGLDSVRTDRIIRPQLNDYALEAAAAYGCGCMASAPVFAAFVMRGLYYMDVGDPHPEVYPVLLCLGFGAYTGGSAASVTLVGKRLGWRGSFLGSLGFSAISAVTGFAVGICSGMSQNSGSARLLSSAGYVLMGAAPLAAVIGYNVGATRLTSLSRQSRLEPPSFSARFDYARGSEGRQAVTLNAKLLTLRF